MTGPEFSTAEIEDWGKFQLVIGDVDRSVFNGIPVKISNWSLREPFSDSAATFVFQNIDPFAPESEYPFKKFDNIEINQVDVNGFFIKNLFEGMIVSVDDSLSEKDSGITIQAIGALYQADYFIRAPVFNDYTFDIGSAVQFEINTRIEYYGLRLQKLPFNTYTNIGSRSRGSWNPLLTGWIQDLLGTAYTDGFMLKGEEACAMVRVEGALGTGLWALGSFGSNLSLGPNIPYYGSASYLTYYVANLYQDFELYTRDMANRPQFDGFWILDRRGKVFCYGNAKHYGDKSSVRIKAWAIESTPSGLGYWILDANGKVYAFGDAVHHGDSPVIGVVRGYEDATVDMATMPDGSGYWLFTRCGKVHAYGTAVDYGDPTLYDRYYASIQPSPTGLGYYCSDTKGRVRVFGDAVFHGETSSPDSWVTDIAISKSGNGYALMNDNGKIVYFGDFPDLGGFDWSMFDEHGANIYQWTLRKDPERRLRFAVKDNWTVNWTVYCGQPGISHELTNDYAWAPNVYYGEGIDNNNCRWRNSKYPNIHPDDAPIWPGYLFSVHENPTASAVRVWQQAMKDRGWPIDVTGVMGWNDNHVAVRFQESAGLQADGVIGPQTWVAVFNTGEDAGNLNGSYFAPIAQRAGVEPFVYGGSGGITGRNPLFDRSIVRIEHYDNYGEKIGKDEATISAQAKIRKDSGVNYAGRIIFKTDPAEGHRFDIREGQNILYKGFKGADWMLHIAQVDFNPEDMSVTCTVDTAFRDAMTIAAIYQRDDPLNANPSRTRTRNQSASKIVEDKIAVWDCVAAGTLVDTEFGPKPIEHVKVGENVWTWSDGELTLKPVQKSESRGKKEVFSVRTGRREIKVTGSHKMLVLGATGTGWAKVDDLICGDKIVSPVNIPTATDITVVDPDYAWLLGVLTADGSLSNDRVIGVSVYGWLREEVKSVMKRLFDLDPHAEDHKHGVNFYSKAVHRSLPEETTRPSVDRQVPDIIWRSSKDAQMAFIDGYMRGDGYVDPRGYSKYASANPTLVKELRALNMMLGRPVTNLNIEERKKKIIINGKEVVNAKPLNRFAVMNGVERGTSKIEGVKDFELTSIRSIVSAGEVETYDLQVADTHNFVASGLVAHNCDSGAGIIPKMGIYAGLWHVIRIPSGEFGQVIQTYFKTSGTSLYSVAVFDRPIRPNDLAFRGDVQYDDKYWEGFAEDTGLIIAWGGQGRMCGYYPGSGADDEPITGVFIDRGSWNYWSTQAPWIWIAIYATTTTYIEGRLYPGQEGTGSIPDAVAIAEPTGMNV